MNIGKNLEKYREKLQYSKLKLSRETGLSARCIENIEHGKITNPGIKTLETLANALNITVEQLIAKEEKVR